MSRARARLERLLAQACYSSGPVCFACGRRGAQPCVGHEYGGTILGSRRRRLAPFWLLRWVDCRWAWGDRSRER